MKKLLVLNMILLIYFSSPVSAKEIPYTQDVRDRLVRLESKVDALEKRIEDLKDNNQKQFDGIQRQFEDVKATMRWGFGILFGAIIAMISFVIWDRRSALSPAINKTRELEEREEKVERVLKELASKDSVIAEALKHAGLL